MERSFDQRIRENIKNEKMFGKQKFETAAALGVSKVTISQYVSGKIRPGLESLSKLCAYLFCLSDNILCIKNR